MSEKKVQIGVYFVEGMDESRVKKQREAVEKAILEREKKKEK